MAEQAEPETAAEAIEQAQALEREIGRALVGQRAVIRELVARGATPRYLLPDPVLDIIERERLYH